MVGRSRTILTVAVIAAVLVVVAPQANIGDDDGDDVLVELELTSSRFLANSSTHGQATNASDLFNTSHINSSYPLTGNASFLDNDAPTKTPTIQPSFRPTTPQPTEPHLEGMQGALVTSDCLFEDGNYPYAIDIFWSCGDERFNEPLRLHTFKRHSRDHTLVFADQLIAYRDDGRLWFDAYNLPRCIQVVDDEELQLSTSRQQCSQFDFLSDQSSGGGGERERGYRLQDRASGLCAGLGATASCSSDRSTGGSECGGVDHRFLPLVMGECTAGLTFQFETEARDCSNGRNERPGNSCF